jgi:hypothetical protein
MTFGEIEKKVRALVNDTESGAYRFASPEIRGFIADAVRHLRNINPAEKYSPETGALDESVPDPAGADAEGAEVRFHPRHEEAVVKYAAHLVYQLDMTDTVNMQLSEALRARAEALMQL